MRNKTQGFTLIELLIVIAIIGILAAVLIPNLLNARSRAQDTAAQSCAKEILTLAEIHAIDNGSYADFDTDFDRTDANSCGTTSVGAISVAVDENEVSGTVASLSGATVNFANNASMTVTRP